MASSTVQIIQILSSKVGHLKGVIHDKLPFHKNENLFDPSATKPEIMFQYAHVKHYSATATDVGIQLFFSFFFLLSK